MFRFLVDNAKWQWWYSKVHFNMVAQLRITDERVKRALFDSMTSNPDLMSRLKTAFREKATPEDVASYLIDVIGAG